MPDYRQILLATDFSDHAAAAARRAVELSRRFGARLTLLHVVDFFPADVPVDWMGGSELTPKEYMEGRVQQMLQALADRFGVSDAAQEVVYSSRAAKYEITQMAGELRADLIVLGAHGPHALMPMLGSTASGVLHAAPCDVLVVRAAAGSKERE